MNKMKQVFLREAKAQGLTTAYIVREPAGFSSCLYKVDVKTGAEQMVLVQDIPQLVSLISCTYWVLPAMRCAQYREKGCRYDGDCSTCHDRGKYREYLKKPKTDKPFPVENPLEKKE